MSEYPPQHDYPTTTTGDGHTANDDAASGMKDKAAASAEAGKQAATDVAQTATDSAKDVAREAQQQARKVVGEAQSQLQDHARDQHKNAVSNLRTLGDELNSMAEQSDRSGLASDVVSQAGTRVSSIASWLDDREPGDLVGEVRKFARQRPGVFLLGALAAGVLAGRLTRGVVAVHADDSGDTSGDPSGDVATLSPPVPAQAPVATTPGVSGLSADPVTIGYSTPSVTTPGQP